MSDATNAADILARITTWAVGQENIRAVILESSRAREGAELDAFSDYDVLLALADTRPFVTDDAWLRDFGEPLVRFRDAFETWGHRAYTRLVLYTDGTKIDYLLWPVALLRQAVSERRLPDALDWGYRVLLDKDDLTAGLPAPTHTAHIPARPSESEYLALI
ncbi:MAG TPA: aminoglycoside 6-adenylyltransferase, partial [Ktedonobacterales bacterium]